VTGQVFVSGGFGPVDERYPDVSASLRARLATADAEYDRQAAREAREHRVRWEASHERAVDAAAWELAQQAGIPLVQARREVGHTPREFIELASARADLEDAQRNARRRQALRQAGIDSDSGDELDVPQPPAIHAEVAARMASPAESAEAVGRGVRRKWLAQLHRGDLR
jgi:hypothetical protein